MALIDGISFTSGVAGTGSFTVGTARPSFMTPGQAVAFGFLTSGQVVSYLAQDSITNPTIREWGHTKFTNNASGGTFTRTVFGAINNGVVSTSPVNFPAPPIVSLTVLAEDIRCALNPPFNSGSPSGFPHYYFSPTGNDSSGDGSAGNPWQTSSPFFGLLYGVGNIPGIDTNGYDIYLNFADGVYQVLGSFSPWHISQDWVGGSPIHFQGDSSNPSAVIFRSDPATSGGSVGIEVNANIHQSAGGGGVTISYIRFEGWHAALYLHGTGEVDISNCVFSQCTNHIECRQIGQYVIVFGTDYIDSTPSLGVGMVRHVFCTDGGRVLYNPSTLTFLNSVAWSGAYLWVESGGNIEYVPPGTINVPGGGFVQGPPFHLEGVDAGIELQGVDWSQIPGGVRFPDVSSHQAPIYTGSGTLAYNNAGGGSNYKVPFPPPYPAVTADMVDGQGSFNLYVNASTGHDDNPGTSASAPFATIQAAINYGLRFDYGKDGPHYRLIVNVADGTYNFTHPIYIGEIYNSSLSVEHYIQGNTTPGSFGNVQVTNTNNGDLFIFASNPLMGWTILGMQLNSANGAGVIALNGCVVSVDDMIFNCGDSPIQTGTDQSVIQIIATDQGQCSCIRSARAFAAALQGGLAEVTNGTITFTNSPAFSKGFLWAQGGGGQVSMNSPSFVNANTVTGFQYNIQSGGLFAGSGVTIPGSGTSLDTTALFLGSTFNEFGVQRFSGIPGSSQVDAGTWMVVKDTSGGGNYLLTNDGGTIKKVQLT